MEVARDFEFDAAHRVIGHRGPCAFLHGHRYRLRVIVEASDLDSLGMVVDFGDLKRIVLEQIVNRWDHAALFRFDDPLVAAVERAQPEAPQRVIRLPDNPTAEVMARVIFQELDKALPDSLSVKRVVLWETPHCRAAFDRADLGS